MWSKMCVYVCVFRNPINGSCVCPSATGLSHPTEISSSQTRNWEARGKHKIMDYGQLLKTWTNGFIEYNIFQSSIFFHVFLMLFRVFDDYLIICIFDRRLLNWRVHRRSSNDCWTQTWGLWDLERSTGFMGKNKRMTQCVCLYHCDSV